VAALVTRRAALPAASPRQVTNYGWRTKAWNRAAFAADLYGRNMWGVPPQGRADYAFFQHIAASLKPRTGRAAILFPHGVLFRQEEKALRERLVRSGLLESVIGLGAGLFYNSPMEAVVVTLRAGRPSGQVDSVMFINAVDLVARERGQSFLRDSDQAMILDAYQRRTNIHGLAAVAKLEQIETHGYSLALPLYVTPRRRRQANGDAGNGLVEAVSAWRAAAGTADAAVTDVLKMLRAEAP
jgi:type I restriction enzyme M protein